MFVDYYQVRTWLEDFIPFVWGKEELGLARIKYLLKLLGNPERKFKSIHIAGTSGKGSVAFYTSRMLQFTVHSSRFTVGLHISPHLVDIRERMQIFSFSSHPELDSRSRFWTSQNDNSLMPMGRFLKLFSEIKPVVEKIRGSTPNLTPSYFEILVAASFKYFAQEKVDWAVVEVGLGGRLDATNVLKPEVSVITNIGLDHTEILGDTVEKIAYEKAGIIKAGVPVVTGASGKALGVIEKAAWGKGSKLVKVSTQKGPVGNQTLAKIALETLGIGVSEASMKKVFGGVFAGRFEEIDKGIILDGAHNPDKIRALIQWIKNSQRLTVNSQLTLVLAFKKGKKWREMVDLLVKNLPVERIIATEFNTVTDTGPAPSQRLSGVNNFAAVPAGEIRDYALKVHSAKCIVISNSQGAVFYSLSTKHSSTTSIVLITGSLYLVGEVRTMWKVPEV